MGEVLALALMIFLIAGVVTLVVLAARAASRDRTPQDSPEFRNHLAMARWIERQLGDDMVRCTIKEPEQAEAGQLLDRFYGERRRLGGGK